MFVNSTILLASATVCGLERFGIHHILFRINHGKGSLTLVRSFGEEEEESDLALSDYDEQRPWQPGGGLFCFMYKLWYLFIFSDLHFKICFTCLCLEYLQIHYGLWYVCCRYQYQFLRKHILQAVRAECLAYSSCQAPGTTLPWTSFPLSFSSRSF